MVELGIRRIEFSGHTGALENLAKVTAAASEVDVNTGMNAWMRMGQAYDVMGKRSQARAAYAEAVKGAPESDAGKE